MTGADLETARLKLGLTAAQLGRKLELNGRDAGRDVRRWETGEIPQVPGPVAVAVRLMAEVQRLEFVASMAAGKAKARETAAEPPEMDKIEPAAPPKARRRG